MFRSPARLIATATLLLIPINACAQDYTSNMIGHWKFDETSGTSAADSSGNSYTGTMSGGLSATTNSVTGINNKALNLDGVNDEIVITGRLGSPTNITVSAWARLTSRGLYGGQIFSIGDDFVLRIDNRDVTSGTAGLFFNNSAGWQLTSSGTDYLGTGWHHYVFVFDDTNNIQKLYVDGAVTATTNYTQSITYQHGTNVNIGRHGTGSPSYEFGGDIDDIRVYNRALSAADISALYSGTNHTCSNPFATAATITYNNSSHFLQYCNGTQWVGIGPASSLSNGLIGHWTLDETSGTTSADNTSGAHNGTMTGGLSASTNSTSGTVGHALSFDGVDDYVASSTGLDLGGNDKATISAWVKHSTATLTTKQALVYKGFAQFETFVDNTNRIRVYMQNNSAWHSSISSPVYTDWDTWHLVTVTYDGANVKIYRDGALVATSGSETGNFPSSTSPFWIGKNSSGVDYINGSIDDARLYNRALSAAEVLKLYNLQSSCTEPAASNLVGHWAMNETTGAAITDTSGNGNNGTWTDGTNNSVAEETLAGQNGTGLSFDETDNVITVPHSASLNVSTGYTVSSWVYFNSTAAASPITASLIAKNDDGNWGHGWVIGRSSGGGNVVGGNIRIAVQHNRNGNGPNSYYSNWVYPVDTWNYVTVSWDGSTVRYYLNGALVDSGALTTAPDTATGTLHIGYGHSNWYSTYHAGRIDDMRIYNRALSDVEISALYGSIGGTCTSASCASPFGAEGTITYNTTHHVMQYCNGDNWIAMNKAGNGGAGCTNPSGTEGSLVYNSDYDTLQYCEGDAWMSAGQKETCGPTASPGAHCQDGSIYVGLTPDGNVPMFLASNSYEVSGFFSLTYNALSMSTTDGDGNTATLIADVGQYPAAEYCATLTAHGHSDWYLPAIDELNMVWNNGTPLGSVTLFGPYWSSTGATGDALGEEFSSGAQNNEDKQSNLTIRCARHN